MTPPSLSLMWAAVPGALAIGDLLRAGFLPSAAGNSR